MATSAIGICMEGGGVLRKKPIVWLTIAWISLQSYTDFSCVIKGPTNQIYSSGKSRDFKKNKIK